MDWIKLGMALVCFALAFYLRGKREQPTDEVRRDEVEMLKFLPDGKVIKPRRRKH